MTAVSPAPAPDAARVPGPGLDESRAGSGTRETELLVEGMTCAACAARVEKKLGRLDGVRATVNYATATALVTAPAGRLRPGDMFVVRPGETIAADGPVLFGQSAVGHSMMTGSRCPPTRPRATK